ncbi:MAG: RNA polymerase sigma factor [Phycisphaerae bacterium]|jgi:RNA polymerase sigma factor (sigma-70 family)
MSESSQRCAEEWTRFYLENRRGIIAFAISQAGNAADAADLVQDTLVRLVRQECAPDDPSAYFFRCLRNEAISRRRARRPNAAALDSAAACFHDAGICDVELRERVTVVQGALSALPDAQRETVVLRIYAEMTFEQIAGILGRPLGTVTSHYARALEALRTALEPEVDDVVQ